MIYEGKSHTSSRIFSAKFSILKILPTTGTKFLCHSKSFILSNTNPSSISTADMFAALKHAELIDSSPDALRYSSTPFKDFSHL